MKKIIISLCVVIVLIVTIITIVNQKENYQETSSLILQKIIKGNYEEVEGYFGIRYFKNVDEGGQSYESLRDKVGQVIDYSFKDDNISKKQKKYTYEIKSKMENYTVNILWEKQPNKWLIADIEAFLQEETNHDTSLYDDDLVDDIMYALIEGDYEKLYEYCSSDFGSIINENIVTSIDLREYIETHFYYTKPRFNEYVIKQWHYDEKINQNICEITINPGYSYSFNLKIIFDKSKKMTGLYIVELDQLNDKRIFNLSTDPTEEKVEIYDSIAEFLSSEKRNLVMEDLNSIYADMSNVFRNSMTIDEFKEYVSIMTKRIGLDKKTFQGAYFLDWNSDYDSNHYTCRQIIKSENYPDFKWISEKDDLEIISYINLFNDISYKNDEVNIEGLFLSRVDAYQTDDDLYSKLNESKKQEIYIPLNVGISKDLTENENSKMRFDKANILIDGLIHEDYEILWAIESKYTALNDVSELKELIEYQKKIVKSFQGAYRPVKGYEWIITGQYILEYAFMTYEGHLNKLIISYDQDNEIIDFNVVRVPRKEDYETY